ncbi:unnamed protein product, partial [Discosporangium mesarthrocarpum]
GEGVGNGYVAGQDPPQAVVGRHRRGGQGAPGQGAPEQGCPEWVVLGLDAYREPDPGVMGEGEDLLEEFGIRLDMELTRKASEAGISSHPLAREDNIRSLLENRSRAADTPPTRVRRFWGGVGAGQSGCWWGMGRGLSPEKGSSAPGAQGAHGGSPPLPGSPANPALTMTEAALAAAAAAVAAAAAAAAAAGSNLPEFPKNSEAGTGRRAGTGAGADDAGARGGGGGGGGGGAHQPVLLSLGDVTAAGLEKLLQVGEDTNMYFDQDAQRWVGEEVDMSGFEGITSSAGGSGGAGGDWALAPGPVAGAVEPPYEKALEPDGPGPGPGLRRAPLHHPWPLQGLERSLGFPGFHGLMGFDSMESGSDSDTGSVVRVGSRGVVPPEMLSSAGGGNRQDGFHEEGGAGAVPGADESNAESKVGGGDGLGFSGALKVPEGSEGVGLE